LKIETQPLEDHQVKLVVEFESEAFEKFKHQAARKISQESKIPGFRPGKAPYEVVRRMFGDPSISNRALDLLIDGTYAEMIEQAQITPSGPGKLDKVITLDPPKLEILVPLLPTVELGDYRSTRLDYTPNQVSTEEVDQFIERLRTNYASVEPVERPIEETDLVFLNISGKFASPAEGEEAEYVKETPQQVIVQKEAEQKTEEWPFPGFTRMLIGLSAGSEKTVSFTYPEDAKEEKLRGKEVEFNIKVQTVKAMKLPELNDEFAQTVGEFESVELMRKSIGDRLEFNAREEYDQDYYTQVIDKVREHATLKYPPQVLEEEVEHVLSHLQQDLARQKLDLDTYIKMRKLEKGSFIENEVKPSAIRRLERSLIMDQIAREEKIEIDPEKLEGAITQTVRQMEASGEYQRARKTISQDKLADAIAIETASKLLNQQTLERIKLIATGQSETMIALEPQTEEGEITPPVTEVADEVEVIEVAKPEESLGETSAEQ
jgi:trigger factor